MSQLLNSEGRLSNVKALIAFLEWLLLHFLLSPECLVFLLSVLETFHPQVEHALALR